MSKPGGRPFDLELKDHMHIPQWGLYGADCHMRSPGDIPVCLVKDAVGSKTYFSNLVETEDGLPLWAVTSCKVHITHMWEASSAVINLHCKLPSIQSHPPELPLGENGIELTPEDEISIEMGYLHTGLQDAEKANTLRVFVGVIKSMAASVTENGVSMTIVALDRMCWLMETQVTGSLSMLKEYFKDLFVDPENKKKVNDPSIKKSDDRRHPAKYEIPRSSLMVAVANWGIGFIPNTKSGPYEIPKGSAFEKNINGGKKIVLDLEGTKDLGKGEAPLPEDFHYKNYLYPRTNNPKVEKDAPYFRMLVGLRGINNLSAINNENFVLENKTPLEFIKYHALQEMTGTEVFCDHRDGNFYYTPRVTYSRSLDDPTFFKRTYYARNINEAEIEKRKVDVNQMALEFKDEFSTFGIKTNFFVYSTGGENGSVSGDTTHMQGSIRPWYLRGKKMANKNIYINVPEFQNIHSYHIIYANAKVTTSGSRVATLKVLGDPTFTPGELVQVVGSPLHPRILERDRACCERMTAKRWLEKTVEYSEDAVSHRNAIEDKKHINETSKKYANTSVFCAKAEDFVNCPPECSNAHKFKPIEIQPEDWKKPDKKVGSKSRSETEVTASCRGTPQNSGWSWIPPSMFRVDGVIHNFNIGNKGYTTEVLLMALG